MRTRIADDDQAAIVADEMRQVMVLENAREMLGKLSIRSDYRYELHLYYAILRAIRASGHREHRAHRDSHAALAPCW